jgi:hypothetical protein
MDVHSLVENGGGDQSSTLGRQLEGERKDSRKRSVRVKRLHCHLYSFLGGLGRMGSRRLKGFLGRGKHLKSEWGRTGRAVDWDCVAEVVERVPERQRKGGREEKGGTKERSPSFRRWMETGGSRVQGQPRLHNQ